MKIHDSCVAIWEATKKIPRGRVSTYGQIAREAGFPNHPRLAGYALKHIPDNMKVPWHRVMNAQGKISLPADSESHALQKNLLEAEGVLFLKGKVDLVRYGWRRKSDAPILD
ncbi:MGMT family protein [Stenotrophobium rhamnosiphilum]|uniref:Methyltransferase n=1 Tax=Stenotrophobium rhamnosiphilum TaxID=2029166 RepID=A0A2T5MG24_9GAMM|nr:methylated-DNA--[protein]-cysteine S-methyltransferase [Stenotrophobium rhamnosiphilum]PTU31537.1 methyltransferase [Stenotrophobium rhamnosiphilum]